MCAICTDVEKEMSGTDDLNLTLYAYMLCRYSYMGIVPTHRCPPSYIICNRTYMYKII